MFEKIKTWSVIASVLCVVGGLGYQIVVLKHDNKALRRERIAFDSLHQVAQGMYERKVREVESQREILRAAIVLNAKLAEDLKKRDVKIQELSSMIVQIKPDSAVGTLTPKDSGSFEIDLKSLNGIVRFIGLAKYAPPTVTGRFEFSPMPPISIILYRDELDYVTARVGIDEKIADLVSYDVTSYKIDANVKSFRFTVGLGPARPFDPGSTVGLVGYAGIAWKTWGVGSIIGPNVIGVMVTKDL